MLGSRFLQDIAEFFILFQAMEDEFVDHAEEVELLLADPRTTFVIVSTLEASPSYEAGYLARELTRRDFHLGAIVANRVLPTSFNAKAPPRSARKLVELADGELAADVAAELDADESRVIRVLTEIGGRFDDVRVVATRESERRAELEALAPLLVSAPMLDRDVNDVSDLLDLAGHLS